jgi:predicted MFS family arabinose efflux permease
MQASRAERREEWRNNWTLVLACAFGFSFSSVINYSFGLFIEPLANEFGWGRAEISIGLTMSGVVSVLLSPLVGWLIDRWGVRRLALPGIVLLTMSIVSLSFADGTRSQWLALWAIFAVVDLAVKSTVWTTAVAYAFKAERSLALAFTLGGVSIALIAGPPLAQALIAAYDWRTAFVVIGLLWGGTALVLNFFFLRDTGRSPRSGAAAPQETGNGLTLAEAIRSLPLLRIGLATFITMLLGIGIQVHLVPILTGGGITRQTAAWFVSLGGVAGSAGKLITGWLMDRVDAGLVGAATLAVSAVGYGLLLDGIRTLPLTVVAIMVIGYAAAAKMQICAYMTSRHAGMRNFGVIFGFMSSLIALGGGLGPFIAGLVFDHYGSYNYLLLASVVGTFLSAAIILGLGHYPDWDEKA